MDAAYVSALFGLAGAVIGGLTSFSTTWLTQKTQLRDKHLEQEVGRRERIFSDFIAEASRLYADALSHEKDDAAELVQLYALLAKMRLVSSRPVVNAAEQVMVAIGERYLAPNLTLHEIHLLAQKGDMNFLLDFGEACRNELKAIRGRVR